MRYCFNFSTIFRFCVIRTILSDYNYLIKISIIELIFVLSIAFLIFSTVAYAALPLTRAGSQVTGGGPPPVCSNSLDFSDGCNSQYIPVI